ncbi:MAG: hypothetical protein WBX01_09385 [Nitrososphaeraceae archaeon]
MERVRIESISWWKERRLKELGYTVPAQPALNYVLHPDGASLQKNAISHYSSQTNKLYNLPYSADPNIPHGHSMVALVSCFR